MQQIENQQESKAIEVVDHFFRHESGRIVAALTKKYGPANLELIEDVVQEALLKAMQHWPYKGVPANPSAWILTVAQNKLLDHFKKEKTKWNNEDKLKLDIELNHNSSEPDLDVQLNDDLLKMIFACCHPKLSKENQIILTLKILCGFSISEIARGLMKNEEAVAKTYTRAKKRFREEVGSLEVPIGKDLNNRLESVHKIIYMIFNEGYHSIDPENLVKKDVCGEAMRLCFLILQQKLLANPKTYALMSLMLFHSSRFDSRVNENGKLVTLENQDREKWDRDLIEEGRYYLDKSSFGTLSEYHLQAGIAAAHSLAASYEETNWNHILMLYNTLVSKHPGGYAKLHRIVALGKVHGAQEALNELEAISTDPKITKKHLYFAIRAHVEKTLGMQPEAKTSYTKAAELTTNMIEKSFLQSQADAL
ncbi:MAG: sigma-70 family RNA polymerase sigma factor [bacterium]|nr:sigma-70 family RNA polymerase sigma factor [bacterium]